MDWVAVSGNEIILLSESKARVEWQVSMITEKYPDLFRKEYITVMSLEEYQQEC